MFGLVIRTAGINQYAGLICCQPEDYVIPQHKEMLFTAMLCLP